MLISIEYKLYNNSTDFKEVLDPKFYFDEDEDVIFGSVARYIFPYEYLNIDLLLIEEIILTIESDKNHYIRTIKFWNNSKCNSDILYIYDDHDKTITEWFKIELEHESYIENLDFYKNKIDLWELQSHVVLQKDDFSQNFIYKKELDKNDIQGTRYI
jgi:hypothetical protein